MKNYRIYFLTLLAISFGFMACSDEETDTEKPLITLNNPQNETYFHPGDEIDFDADFSDNVALKQIKIDIHIAEGHEHKSAVEEGEWHWDTIVDLSGQSMRQQFDIPVPLATEHGEYHFIVYATDEAGNESFQAILIDVDYAL